MKRGRFHKQNKQQYLQRMAMGLCRGCGQRKPVKGKVLCGKCLTTKLDNYYKNKEHKLAQQRKYRAKLKEATFAAYGRRCACCGELRVEFLSVDHVDGDGAEHRRQIGPVTQTIHVWLKRNGYPRGFQILCMNCNFAKGMYGYCPHEKERQMAIEKYGVDESVDQESLEKKAAEGCPKCGKPAVRHGNVLMCPNCGTEPFEKPEEKK